MATPYAMSAQSLHDRPFLQGTCSSVSVVTSPDGSNSSPGANKVIPRDVGNVG